MKKIRLTFAIIFIAPVFIVLAVIAMFLAFILRVFHLNAASDKAVHGILSPLIKWIFLFLGVKLIVEGKENIPAEGERTCIVANHQSIIDIPVLYGAGLWCGIVAKKELFKIPLLHGLLLTLHCLPIDRSSLRASLQTIIQGADRIKKGMVMGIFPEGTRNKTGNVGDMKAGAFKMATKAGAKVVPVAIKNSRYSFESIDSFRRVHIYVKILPAIDTTTLDDEGLKGLHSVVENEIRAAHDSLPSPYGRA